MENVKIVVRQNGEVIAKKPMRKAIPAEMVQFDVKGAKPDAGAVEVSVESVQDHAHA